MRRGAAGLLNYSFARTTAPEVRVEAGAVLALPVTLRASAGAVAGRADIEFVLEAAEGPEVRYEEDSRFFGPAP